MTRKVLGFSVSLIVILLAVVYYKLGGFNSLQVETIEVNNYHLVGRYFEGSYKSDTVGRYFEEMRGYLDTGILIGQLVIIYDQELIEKHGKTRSFIGVMLEQNQLSSHEDLEKREIPAKRSIRVSKDAHIAVMPNPDRIDRLIQAYAQDEDLTASELNIEIYYHNNRLVIERPILSGID